MRFIHAIKLTAVNFFLVIVCCDIFHYLQVEFTKVGLVSLKRKLFLRHPLKRLLQNAYVKAVVEAHVRKISIFPNTPLLLQWLLNKNHFSDAYLIETCQSNTL